MLKNIDFINKALEDVWENIVKYETSPDNHAPVKSIFYTMMQFLLSDNSELHCREGDEYRVISSKIASFDIDGDTTGYTISEISRELIMKHIEKWLNNTREEVQ